MAAKVSKHSDEVIFNKIPAFFDKHSIETIWPRGMDIW
jgi:hypothetical protein